MFSDSRADRRYRCQLRVIGGSQVSFIGAVKDLSVSGLRLITTVPVEPGRQLHLDLELPTGRVDAVGEVRRMGSSEEGLELGIRFTRIDADGVVAIRRATEARPRATSFPPRIVRSDD